MKERDIFIGALEIESPEEQAAFLDRTCAGDSSLRQRVEALLRSHDKGNSFLESPPAAIPDPTIDQPITEKPGTQIGPYKLLQQLGEGGMGVVYMAEQEEPVKRRVALKIIKPGMDTRQVIARFEAERQALAMMDHPNIAKVLDAGATESGRPYFVMELVKGVPVTQYCDEQHLTPKERMELYMPICQAVQHAHQKGIIHRDIKPSNILVALFDGQPVPKVIDFGVAKATSQTLTEKTMFTQLGQVVGTLEYMSPEQAQMNQLDVDTRSDIYSLGVLLYELLTGDTPFDRQRLRSAAFDEMLRIIREEEPPKPSTKLSGHETLSSIAASRHVDPQKLTSLVRGELDWIVMKTLEKDRTRRYQTANGLVADIRRFLNGEPVEACPPSTTYRMRKFVLRNRAALATVSVMGIGVLIAVIALFVSNVRIRKEQAQTTAALNRESVANENLTSTLERERRTLYFHRIALAKRELDDNSVRRARRQLHACPVSLRDWEWYHLNGLSDRSVRTLEGHTHRVFGLSVRPDGKQIASGSWDGTVRIWEAATGKLIRTLPLRLDADGEVDAVWSVDYAPNGERIAIGTWKAIRVWNPDRGKIELQIDLTAERNVLAVVFSPDGRRIASVAEGGDTVDVWNASTGERVRQLRGNTDSILSLTYSPDGKWILTGGMDGAIRLWDAATGELIKSFPGHELGVGAVAFNASASRIVSGGKDRTVRIWDVESGQMELKVRGHGHWVGGVAFHPSGTSVASACADNGCKVWDAETGNETLSLRGHEAPCSRIAFDPDGKWIVSASWDGTLKIWDITQSEQIRSFRGHREEITSVAFSPDGRRVASGSFDDTIRIWNTVDDDELILAEHTGDVTCVAFTPDGRWLISGSRDGALRIWEAATGRCINTLIHPQEINAVAVAPAGGFVVSGCSDNIARSWTIPDGQLVMKLAGHAAAVTSVAVDMDGAWVVTGSKDRTCRVWDVASGQQLQTFRGHAGPVNSLAISPDGKCIVSCCRFTDDERAGRIKLWDPLTAEELTVKLQTHPGPCGTVRFNTTGSRILATSLSGFIVLFDAVTGQEALALRLHMNEVTSAAFDVQGQRIASGGNDRTVRLLEAPRIDSAGSQQPARVISHDLQTDD